MVIVIAIITLIIIIVIIVVVSIAVVGNIVIDYEDEYTVEGLIHFCATMHILLVARATLRRRWIRSEFE